MTNTPLQLTPFMFFLCIEKQFFLSWSLQKPFFSLCILWRVIPRCRRKTLGLKMVDKISFSYLCLEGLWRVAKSYKTLVQSFASAWTPGWIFRCTNSRLWPNRSGLAGWRTSSSYNRRPAGNCAGNLLCCFATIEKMFMQGCTRLMTLDFASQIQDIVMKICMKYC